MSEADVTAESRGTQTSKETLIADAKSALALLKQASASVVALQDSLDLYSGLNEHTELQQEKDNLSSAGDSVLDAIHSIAQLAGLVEHAFE